VPAREAWDAAWRGFLARGESVSSPGAGGADAVSPDALSDLLFTSGTTGRPKA
jgi:long-subunit acyl-CoA synthetase (AMP-forming)